MTNLTTLASGARLRSQACTTEVIVIRPGTGVVQVTCGGQPMVDVDATIPAGLVVDPNLNSGNVIGKRYTADADPTMEVLVTKAGAGTLADGSNPLIVKTAKNLPASD
ncbi:hypothetical protein [Rhodococcus sp. OK302]|uniref:hypothetical protein n=1 Tax=Rhodococcus sp. OK302 TaxID=1882769 RepID=UPI000B93D697|nr:hypothetical protein [Rhodococcus sp. OK302]OYD61474.1 hypothetical protein BDB13_6460 [Rhodococcus sp. OK302]